MSERIARLWGIAFDGFMMWKLAALRCLISAVIAMVIAFATCQVASSQTDWEAMWWLKKWQFWAGIIAVGLKDLHSFLDQTVTALRRQVPENEVPSP